MSEHLPRFHPEDIAEIVKSLSAEARQIFSREITIQEMITFDIDEVGLILKKHPQTISQYCKKKIIKAFKAGADWRITQESLNNYINGNS